MDSWEFVEDDDGFFAWLEANPEGYFVNVVPGLYDHGILHPARCGHVHRSAGPWTNARKVCAETHLAVMRAGPGRSGAGRRGGAGTAFDAGSAERAGRPLEGQRGRP